MDRLPSSHLPQAKAEAATRSRLELTLFCHLKGSMRRQCIVNGSVCVELLSSLPHQDLSKGGLPFIARSSQRMGQRPGSGLENPVCHLEGCMRRWSIVNGSVFVELFSLFPLECSSNGGNHSCRGARTYSTHHALLSLHLSLVERCLQVYKAGSLHVPPTTSSSFHSRIHTHNDTI